MTMTCLEARKCIYAYLNNKLNDTELRDFLRHIDECPECKEELRITHMVYSGVQKLDAEDSGDLNIDESFRKTIESSKRRLFALICVRVTRYVVDTCVFWAFLLMAFMQLRFLLT